MLGDEADYERDTQIVMLIHEISSLDYIYQKLQFPFAWYVRFRRLYRGGI